MLNFLFISNSLRTDVINKFLQPLLKVKIDLVTDFDNGLKDVFEKRPATIFIQEQIAGVTGESVARHIQMLLGDGAPSFILMHEGNSRIKPIRGLFEHLIDLTQPDNKLLENVLTILESILGPEWEKIVIADKQGSKVRAASHVVPEENRVDADRLVDDFLSDLGAADGSVLGNTISQPQPAQSNDQVDEPFEVESTTDILARMLAESAQEAKVNAESPVAAQIDKSEPEVPAEPLQPKQKEKPTRPAGVSNRQKSARRPEAADVLQNIEKPVPFTTKTASRVQDQVVPVSKSTAIPPISAPEKTDSIQPAAETEKNSTFPTPAEFRISAGSQETQEQISEELLRAFENNYHSHTNFRKRLAIAVVVLVLVTAGWLLLRQKHSPISLMKVPAITQSASTTEVKKKADVTVATTAVATQKPISTSHKPSGTTSSQLPSFITAGSLGSSFSARKQGWERYIGKAYECRVFRTGGYIKAVQVLAGTGKSISDTFMESALKEVTGSSGFSVNSKEQKNGFLVQRGSAGKKADLLIYRNKTSGAIRAFVVSLK